LAFQYPLERIFWAVRSIEQFPAVDCRNGSTKVLSAWRRDREDSSKPRGRIVDEIQVGTMGSLQGADGKELTTCQANHAKKECEIPQKKKEQMHPDQ
jgi:hypothetical protein